MSQNQSVFVPGRQISGNALAAFEIFHLMNTKHSGKKGYMALKIYMSKAYDKVEWNFLACILSFMGFSFKWSKLIMKCVSIATFLVLIKCAPTRNLKPSRGLKQGDPLSPYLFIMCAESFSALLSRSLENHNLHGISICNQVSPISHLLFVDDNIIFSQATYKEGFHIAHLF